MTPDGPPASSSSDHGGPSALSAENLLDRLSGQPEEACRKAVGARGGLWRVCARDGRPYAMTMDYRPNRVNVEISAGIVTRAWLG